MAVVLPRSKFPVVADVEALGSLEEGELGYDDTENTFKLYNGTVWVPASLPNPVTDGNVLTVDAASPGKTKWADSGAIVRAKEVVQVYRSAAQSLTTGAVVGFDTEISDPSGIHDAVTNKGRVTPTRAGWYRVSATVRLGSSEPVTNTFWLGLFKNGSVDRYLEVNSGAGGTSAAQLNGTGLIYCNGSTDYFDIRLEYTGPGSPYAINVGATNTYMSVEFVSADYAGSLTTPKFRAYRSTSTAANASGSIVGWSGTDYNDGGGMNAGSGAYTATVAGKHHFDAHVTLAGTYATTTYLTCRLYKNGALAAVGEAQYGMNIADLNALQINADLTLAAGDTVDLRIFISTGNWTVYGDSTKGFAYLSGHLIRDDAAVPTSMEAWHSVGGAGEPAFENSWANTGGSETPCQFRKTPWGDVEIRGLIKNGTLGTHCFTLPVGYRPAYSTGEEFMLINSNGTTHDLTARAQLGSDGKVYILDSANGTGHWVSLAGIRFSPLS